MSEAGATTHPARIFTGSALVFPTSMAAIAAAIAIFVVHLCIDLLPPCAFASTLSVGLQVIFPRCDSLRRVMLSGGAFPDVPRSWHEAAAVITPRVARSGLVK